MKIFEQELKNEKGVVCGKFAMIVGGVGEPNPKEFIDKAVYDYVGNLPHNQFIEIHLDNPYCRIITTSLHELPLREFKETDSLKVNKRTINIGMGKPMTQEDIARAFPNTELIPNIPLSAPDPRILQLLFPAIHSNNNDIDDRIEEWHNSDSNLTLQEYLGMDNDEYYTFVKDGIYKK